MFLQAGELMLEAGFSPRRAAELVLESINFMLTVIQADPLLA